MARSGQYLVSADFPVGPVDVEQRHEVALAGDELLADGEDVVSACGRIVEDRVDGEERDEGQNLLSAGELGRDQQSLWRRRKLPLQFSKSNKTSLIYMEKYVFHVSYLSSQHFSFLFSSMH